ncbi:SPX domain-containing protein 1-like [Rosa sericea]
MKFSKSLGILIEEALPEWRDKFLSYKDLKKQLKLIYPKDGGRPPSKRPRLSGDDEARKDGGDFADADDNGEGGDVSKAVADFVRLLENEMDKFNSFFEEKEEEYVIRWKELQERVAEAKDSNEELMRVGREIVDFHGEMVLLENYSALNYTGLLKILKKHDKRTGALIRFPFVQRVMQQPFFSTDVLNKLVKECEVMLDHVFSRNDPSGPSEAAKAEEQCDSEAVAETREIVLKAPIELAEIKQMESVYGKQTETALRVLKDVRSGSSTVSAFSLPPLQINVVEEDSKNIHALEQEAK